MSMLRIKTIKVGDSLPALRLPPLSRLTLAQYCGASGDYNPIHVDSDYARDKAGLDDVIGHGSLTMAQLGRLLTNCIPQTAIKHLKIRLKAATHTGDIIICTGEVVEKTDETIKISLRATSEKGVCVASGEATACLE
jgi:acyl dehydratase